MFLCKVVCGITFNSAIDKSLTAPPFGHDSVVGQTQQDELVVYDEKAIIPSYLIIYDY